MARDDEQRVVDADAEPDHRREHLGGRRQVDERGEERDRSRCLRRGRPARCRSASPIAMTEPNASRRITIATSSPMPSGAGRWLALGEPAGSRRRTRPGCRRRAPGPPRPSAGCRCRREALGCRRRSGRSARAMVSSADRITVAAGGGATTWRGRRARRARRRARRRSRDRTACPWGSGTRPGADAAREGRERRLQEVGRLLGLDAGQRELVFHLPAGDLAACEEANDDEDPGDDDPPAVAGARAAQAIEEPRHGSRLTAHQAFDTYATIFSRPP